jgi:hypothetical protein
MYAKFWYENLKARDYFGVLCVDRVMILKGVLKII